MKKIIEFIKTTTLGGLVVIVPASVGVRSYQISLWIVWPGPRQLGPGQSKVTAANSPPPERS